MIHYLMSCKKNLPAEEKKGFAASFGDLKDDGDVFSTAIAIDFDLPDEEDVGRTAMQRLAWRRLLRENNVSDCTYNRMRYEDDWVYGEFDGRFE